MQHNAYHKVDVLEQKVTVHKWDLNFVGQVAACMVHGELHGGLHHGIENNYLSDGRPSCIRFWETESDSLVLFCLRLDIFSG